HHAIVISVPSQAKTFLLVQEWHAMKASSYVFSPFPFQRCALLLLLVGIAAQGLCQTPQQRVYATGTPANNANAAVISGFDKNTLSGSLAAIPSSPFSAHNAAPMAVDGQGKFLFVAGPTSIAMSEIDPASGALTEVPHSPFPYIPTLNANQAPSDALSIATEPTGQFVYVGFQNGDFPGNPQGNSSITPYVIDTSNAADPVLVLGPQLSLDFNAQPVKLFVEPTGRHLYIALGTGGGNSYGGFDLFDIDGSTGELSNLRTIDTPDVPSQVSAMDPEGRSLSGLRPIWWLAVVLPAPACRWTCHYDVLGLSWPCDVCACSRRGSRWEFPLCQRRWSASELQYLFH